MLTRWNNIFAQDQTHPLAVFDEWNRQLNQLFHESRNPRVWKTFSTQGPAFRLYDESDRLVLLAEVPGMTEEQLSLSANADGMTISGNMEQQAPEGYTAQRQERPSISFSRSFNFPCRVDLDQITATLKDGVLEISIAKAPEAKPRQISVKVG